ncbi:hypothetical protein [Streptacidiphilus cavernicola]|uniref:Uncharacterized protein n=1 Tax=Streptacidiphilus cavernicola TaxID=3342716 RepID=A0ABV6W0V4_9ACTN
MGRQKQNKPRRERPTLTGTGQPRMAEIAGMLDLFAGVEDGGPELVLEVAEVGLRDGGAGPAWIRLADGSVKLLPESLRAWAGRPVESGFPRRIGFGVRDGAEYARLL